MEKYRHNRIPEAPAVFDPAFGASGVGYARVETPAYRWHGLQRSPGPFAVWQYTISGSGALDLGGQTFRLNPGSAMLVAVPEDHCYYLPPDSDHWEFCYLILTGDGALETVRQLRAHYGSVLALPDGSGCAADACDWLRQTESRPLLSRYELAETVFRFLMKLAGELESAGDAARSEPAFIAEIRRRVALDPNVPVEKLRRIAGYSRGYFERIFRQYTGVTPGEFLRQQRLRTADELLSHTRMPVKEIARRCGFPDAGYFGRLYRKRFGATPGERRERVQRGISSSCR